MQTLRANLLKMLSKVEKGGKNILFYLDLVSLERQEWVKIKLAYF